LSERLSLQESVTRLCERPVRGCDERRPGPLLIAGQSVSAIGSEPSDESASKLPLRYSGVFVGQNLHDRPLRLCCDRSDTVPSALVSRNEAEADTKQVLNLGSLNPGDVIAGSEDALGW